MCPLLHGKISVIGRKMMKNYATLAHEGFLHPRISISRICIFTKQQA